VPGAAEESERRVVLQVEQGLVGWCEPLDARAPTAALFELVAAAEFLRLVVPGCPFARSAPRRGLRLRVVQRRVVLRHGAALPEYAPQDSAAR